MKTPTSTQIQIGFSPLLVDQLNSNHPLFRLANEINWLTFEHAFSKHYSSKMGKPSKPIRLMVSLLILKQLRNLSDESVVEQWSENVFYQYFSGNVQYSCQRPCVPTELVEFRKRIGVEGVELIFKESIRVNGKDADDDTISADTTVQEKNITYPTDDKLYKKVIKECQEIAKTEDLDLRQTYKRTINKLSRIQRFKKTKYGAKNAKSASKKIKTIAGRLLRDVGRKLPANRLSIYSSKLDIYQRVLNQKRSDSNKIYSIHEPDVKCYTKGKEHKKFEFGSKVSILLTQNTGVIVGAMNFNSTEHDNKTIEKAIQQYERLTEKKAKSCYVDRGYRGISKVNDTKILVPKPNPNISKEQRKGHSKRAAIEPIIGHLKRNYRLGRNFLKGIKGDEINVLMAASAMNFKRVMNLWLTEAIFRWKLILNIFLDVYQKHIAQKLGMTF
jgi:IS5 family transposase